MQPEPYPYFLFVLSICVAMTYLSRMIHLALIAAACLCSELHVMAFSGPPLPTSSFFSIRQHQHHFLSASSTATELKNESFSLAYPLTQVVSDIDDTLKSSGGVTVAGVSLGTRITL